jgi:hypothetical protein
MVDGKVIDPAWYPNGPTTVQKWVKKLGGYPIVHAPGSVYDCLAVDSAGHMEALKGVDLPDKPTSTLGQSKPTCPTPEPPKPVMPEPPSCPPGGGAAEICGPKPGPAAKAAALGKTPGRIGQMGKGIANGLKFGAKGTYSIGSKIFKIACGPVGTVIDQLMNPPSLGSDDMVYPWMVECEKAWKEHAEWVERSMRAQAMNPPQPVDFAEGDRLGKIINKCKDEMGWDYRE